MDTSEVKKVVCFCCEKEFEEKDITRIEAHKDEFRFICKKCNYLPKLKEITTTNVAPIQQGNGEVK